MMIQADVVASAMARTLTDPQKTAVEEIIQGLEDDLQAFLKKPLTPQTVTDEVVTYRNGRIFLKKTPVVSVSSFSIAGTVIDATNYRVETWGLSGVYSIFGPSSLLVPDPVLLVSYVGGLDGDDPESDFGRKVRSALKRAAMRDCAQVVIEQAPGVRRMSVEGTTLDFTGDGAGGWLEKELASFTRWKKRTVRT